MIGLVENVTVDVVTATGVKGAPKDSPLTMEMARAVSTVMDRPGLEPDLVAMGLSNMQAGGMEISKGMDMSRSGVDVAAPHLPGSGNGGRSIS